MLSKTRVAVFAVGLVIIGIGRTHAQQSLTYAIIDLGTLGGARSSAMGVNNRGQVVGFADTSDGTTRAFVYLGGSLVDMGTLGGSESMAYRISDNGVVVGRAQDHRGSFRAFVASIGGAVVEMTQLDPRASGEFGTAVGVSPKGEVAGYFTTAADHMAARNRVFLYRDFQVTDVGTFGGTDGVVAAINDAGDLAGYFSSEPHADYAQHRSFLVRGGQVVAIPTLGGERTTARDINGLGRVIGEADTAQGEPRAFTFSDGKIRDLGTLPGGTQSAAFGINEAGDIVGFSDDANASTRAVLMREGIMLDLNTVIPSSAGWVLTEARDINDKGQIVGTGWVQDQQRAFLLTPVVPAR